jgi:hypothetical protein
LESSRWHLCSLAEYGKQDNTVDEKEKLTSKPVVLNFISYAHIDTSIFS